jgi:hypothetical protein
MGSRALTAPNACQVVNGPTHQLTFGSWPSSKVTHLPSASSSHDQGASSETRLHQRPSWKLQGVEGFRQCGHVPASRRIGSLQCGHSRYISSERAPTAEAIASDGGSLSGAPCRLKRYIGKMTIQSSRHPITQPTVPFRPQSRLEASTPTQTVVPTTTSSTTTPRDTSSYSGAGADGVEGGSSSGVSAVDPDGGVEGEGAASDGSAVSVPCLPVR